MIRAICGRTQLESESGKLVVASQYCILPELGLVILAHQLIFRLDVFAKI